MRPASLRAAPFMAGLVLMASLMLLVVAAVQFIYGGGVQAGAATLHLQQAEWQETEAGAASVPPATLDSSTLPQHWQRVALPFSPSIELLNQARSGTANSASQPVRVSWLRVPVTALPTGTVLRSLYGARIKTDGTIALYINGRLVHRAQRHGPLYNSTRTPLWLPLDDEVGAAPVTEILLRLEHTPRSQIALASLWLGPTEGLHPRYAMRQWLQLGLPAMLSAAFMAVGIFAMFVWLRRPQETAYLLFFNLASSAFLRGLHFYADLPVANNWFAWLTVNSLFWLVLAGHFFLCQLHQRPLTLLTRMLSTTTVVVSVLTLPPLAILPNMPTVTPLIYAVAAVMGASACMANGFFAWRRSREGRTVALGVGLCTLLGLCDWLLQNNFTSAEGWYLGAYINAVCFCVFGLLMYRRYVDAIAGVERLNASLAQRLAARETELEASYRRLREVELQQTISQERQRLMQDMHDGLGSSLISAIRAVDKGAVSTPRISQILKDCLDDLKLTIDSMEPVEADLLLLLATLRFRLEPRLEGSGVTLLWQAQELPALPWLDPSSGLHILRIVQECIANVLRHTNATEIRIGTAVAEHGVQVMVRDNGQGFDVEQALARAGGRGLHNQRRRAMAVDGQVHWQSGPDGTLCTLWLPFQRR